MTERMTESEFNESENVRMRYRQKVRVIESESDREVWWVY